MDEQIFDKIQKLLNLGKGSNYEGESEVALKKAYDLMNQYNVSMVDLEGRSREKTLGPLGHYTVNDGESKKWYDWEVKLLAIISDIFDCKVISTRSGFNYDTYSYNKTKVLGIVGREGNARTAELMFKWVDEKTKKEAHKWFKYERAVWKSYCLGVVIAVAKTAEEIKAKKNAEAAAGERDLMIINEVDQFMNSMFGDVKASKDRKVDIKSQKGFEAGYQKGSEINFNKQFGLKALCAE